MADDLKILSPNDVNRRQKAAAQFVSGMFSTLAGLGLLIYQHFSGTELLLGWRGTDLVVPGGWLIVFLLIIGSASLISSFVYYWKNR